MPVNGRRRAASGFTLVELMVTVMILAILAAIANSSYRKYVIRGHRTAAMAQMMDLANREQQILLTNRVYANKGTLVADGYALEPSVAQFYDWDVTLTLGPPPGFLITFTPKGGQASDGPLTLDSQGARTPADKWRR